MPKEREPIQLGPIEKVILGAFAATVAVSGLTIGAKLIWREATTDEGEKTCEPVPLTDLEGLEMLDRVDDKGAYPETREWSGSLQEEYPDAKDIAVGEIGVLPPKNCQE